MPELKDHTFKECFEILRKVQRPKAKNTYAQCEAILKHLEWFERNCSSLYEFEMSYEEVWSDYLSHCQRESELPGKKPRMLGHDRRYLVMALRRANVKGWINKNFSKQDFALLQFSEPIGKHVPDEPLQKMLTFLSEHHLKTYLQVLMGYTMGMRISEILHLKKEEIDFEAREINLDPKRLKTRRARKTAIPITNAVYALLKSHAEASPGDFVFPAIDHGELNPNKPQCDNSYWWKAARRHAKITCRFHDLRHTCLTNALARGMPPLTAAKIFGCTQQVLEKVYDHIRLKDKELHRAILDGETHTAK